MQGKFGSRLREERTRLGLTQVQIAVALGMPAVTYRSYESGRSEPPLSTFEKLEVAGLDAFFVATGQRVDQALHAQVDWELAVDLATLIASWSNKRTRKLTIAEQANYLRACLTLAASRDAAAARQMLDQMLQVA